MPLFFFHLRNSEDLITDQIGRELAGLEEARSEALVEARALIAADARTGKIDFDQRIEVEDADGSIVHVLPLARAVVVKGE